MITGASVGVLVVAPPVVGLSAVIDVPELELVDALELLPPDVVVGSLGELTTTMFPWLTEAAPLLAGVTTVVWVEVGE